MDTDHVLQPRWQTLWQALGVSQPPAGLHETLITAWNEPHRHYHTLEHLRECLGHLDAVRPLAVQPAYIELALWFHDAIYDPRGSDNELRSADLARRAMQRAGCTKVAAGTIRSMILATQHHGRPETPDAALLLDIDLSILGASDARFDRYDVDIRTEYHSVPWPAYVTGRRGVLRGFLDRERIFVTDHFHDRLDARARSNLARSLERLQS